MFDERWFLGYVDKTPDLDDGTHGRVRLLGVLDDSRMRLDRIDPKEHPTSYAFWPAVHPPPPPVDGLLIQVRVSHAPKYGEDNPKLDWWQVHRSRQWHAETCGARLIVPAGWCDLTQRPPTIISRRLRDGLEIYVESRSSEPRVTGPWRVDREARNLEPSRGNYVVSYDVSRDSIAPTVHSWSTHGETLKCFVVPPREDDGQPVDFMSPSSRAKWFGQVLGDAAPVALQSLDRAVPGWRKALRDRWQEAQSDFQRRLELARLDNLEECVAHLERFDQSIWQRVFAREPYSDLLSTRCEQIVEARRNELLDEATAGVAGAQRELESRFKALVEERRQLEARHSAEVQAIARPLEEARSQVDAEERRLADLRKEAEEHEAKMAAATALLADETQRVVAEFHAFQRLLGETPRTGAQPPVATAPAAGLPPTAGPSAAATAPGGRSQGAPLSGDPIKDADTFVTANLLPCLTLWLPAAPTLARAKFVHAALLACRATRIPSVRWARGYADAMGGTARLHCVPVAPTWLAPADALPALRTGWSAAVREPNALVLLALQGVNRSLFQSWGAPLLNALSGVTERLEFGTESLEWPANLRVLATESDDEAVLELPSKVWEDWAWIDPGLTEARNGTKQVDGIQLGEATTGHVLLEDWREWGPLAAGQGPRGASELAALVRVLRRLGFDEPERRARKLRAHARGEL